LTGLPDQGMVCRLLPDRFDLGCQTGNLPDAAQAGPGPTAAQEEEPWILLEALPLLEEFKRFAFKGNVVELAVGVIIGGAFGKIVDSLVKHIIMPVIGVILPGQQGYLGWKLSFAGKDIPYGLFPRRESSTSCSSPRRSSSSS